MKHGKSLPAEYRVEVAGRLDGKYTEWFYSLNIETRAEDDGSVTTVLTGLIQDQAVLYGLISRLRDLGLLLLSVRRIGE
jgi:hypothetical protein